MNVHDILYHVKRHSEFDSQYWQISITRAQEILARRERETTKLRKDFENLAEEFENLAEENSLLLARIDAQNSEPKDYTFTAIQVETLLAALWESTQ